MCGIAGTYQQVDGQQDRPMGECMTHRGPDEAGSTPSSTGGSPLHFAHRRLSIIDLSHGHQPFVKHGRWLSPTTASCTTPGAPCELAARGASFITHSDTEVVLEAWREWGPDCLRRFRGMFAFAVLDQDDRIAVPGPGPVRDQAPLLLPRKDGVVFTSELKALVRPFGSEMHMAPGAMVASILYYWVPDQRCSDTRGREAPARNLGGVPS